MMKVAGIPPTGQTSASCWPTVVASPAEGPQWAEGLDSSLKGSGVPASLSLVSPFFFFPEKPSPHQRFALLEAAGVKH